LARFSVFSGLLLVGYTALESGDPPMGVAFGEFEPAEGYRMIQDECRTNHRDQSALALTVRSDAGVVIQCAGVGILDYSQGLQPDFIEINVLGIPSLLYVELFPA
jgi:hypothetical protein